MSGEVAEGTRTAISNCAGWKQLLQEGTFRYRHEL